MVSTPIIKETTTNGLSQTRPRGSTAKWRADVTVCYLQGLVVPLQLSAEPLQLAASQHGPAVLALQLVLLLHHLQQLLLQHLQLLLVTPVLFQLQNKNPEKGFVQQ